MGRSLAGAIEQHSDEGGIIFPKTIAPYEVILVSLNTDNSQVMNSSDEMYLSMVKEGIHVLWDDRAESAGIKFNDADLLGMPLRMVMSKRNIENGVVEIKMRDEKDGYTIPIEKCIDEVSRRLKN